ncbi:MAG: UDP-3-O-(3-hydroxymyristoyl)glucosamine N-acyltransferase [Deltaproteobacteria bacterium]|nr:UDP-3-O-(3-hydroxymyristoyl)glucosamine N-acyltransferase [Deltaproteobacteria bacterium]
MTTTLEEIASLVGGDLDGDGTRVVSGVAAIDEAGPGEVTFLHHPKYLPLFDSCRAGAVIVSTEIRHEVDGRERPFALIVAQNPYLAMARVARHFEPARAKRRGVAPSADVAPDAVIGADVEVQAGAHVAGGVRIGDRSVISAGAFLGENVQIGADAVLHPNVVVRDGCRIGDRVILHPGVVVGADGFGFAWDGACHLKIPQAGIVAIEDDVEVGANATIDRATFGETRIGRGTKIDNLVHIGHNVVVGENVLIVAQTGVAGSCRIEDGAAIGGQVGMIPHVTVGKGAKIVPQSGIAKDVPAGEVVAGSPAMPHRVWLRVAAILPKLPDLYAALRKGGPA